MIGEYPRGYDPLDRTDDRMFKIYRPAILKSSHPKNPNPDEKRAIVRIKMDRI